MPRSRFGVCTLVLSLGAQAGLGTAIAGERCAGVPLEVTAPSLGERHLTCSAAGVALHLLGRCGITLHKPLHVHVVAEVRHPYSGVTFGLFDTKQERVLVTQEANVAGLVADTPYVRLPRREFYKSLVVHEVVHGVMHQNFTRQPSNRAVYEYPAYALQIASLPALLRYRFLQAIPNRSSSSEFALNDSILLFDPFFFAARAYQHYKASADACADLRTLLQGEVSFIPPTF
jgi:hypothetical protein